MRCIWARSGFDAVKICCCAVSSGGRRGWTWKNYPHLPLADVQTTKHDYMGVCCSLRPSCPPRLPLPSDAMSRTRHAPGNDTPQVLLEHHLKQLRAAEFLREYDKVTRQCAAEGWTISRFCCA